MYGLKHDNPISFLQIEKTPCLSVFLSIPAIYPLLFGYYPDCCFSNLLVHVLDYPILKLTFILYDKKEPATEINPQQALDFKR